MITVYHPTPFWKYLLGAFLGFLAILAGLMIFAALSRGDTSVPPVTYTQEELKEVEQGRDISFDQN